MLGPHEDDGARRPPGSTARARAAPACRLSRRTRPTARPWSAVVTAGLTWTSAGSCSSASASPAISGGIVAEKSSVSRLAGSGADRAHVADEAHVEHPVGLVEHEDGSRRSSRRTRWRIRSSRRPGVAMRTSGASRRAASWGRWLTPPKMTVCRTPKVAAVGLDPLVDLGGELAGRGQDEHPHAVGAARPGGEPLQQRQDERGGLPGACLRARQDVTPGEHVRDHRVLHRRGGGVALLQRRADEAPDEAEAGERRPLDGGRLGLLLGGGEDGARGRRGT